MMAPEKCNAIKIECTNIDNLKTGTAICHKENPKIGNRVLAISAGYENPVFTS
jgi:hypothetical protein